MLHSYLQDERSLFCYYSSIGYINHNCCKLNHLLNQSTGGRYHNALCETLLFLVYINHDKFITCQKTVELIYLLVQLQNSHFKKKLEKNCLIVLRNEKNNVALNFTTPTATVPVLESSKKKNTFKPIELTNSLKPSMLQTSKSKSVME